MKEVSCKIIEDLIPLVRDGIASEESQTLVREHIEGCQACSKLWQEEEQEAIELIRTKDKEILGKIKRKIYLSQTLILLVGALVGVGLTNSFGMFYNISLLPLLGALSFFFLKEKWYITPVAIGILTYLWQIGQSIIEGYFVWEISLGSFFLTGIYISLVILGAFIGLLIKFALGKEKEDYEK